MTVICITEIIFDFRTFQFFGYDVFIYALTINEFFKKNKVNIDVSFF